MLRTLRRGDRPRQPEASRPVQGPLRHYVGRSPLQRHIRERVTGWRRSVRALGAPGVVAGTRADGLGLAVHRARRRATARRGLRPRGPLARRFRSTGPAWRRSKRSTCNRRSPGQCSLLDLERNSLQRAPSKASAPFNEMTVSGEHRSRRERASSQLREFALVPVPSAGARRVRAVTPEISPIPPPARRPQRAHRRPVPRPSDSCSDPL